MGLNLMVTPIAITPDGRWAYHYGTQSGPYRRVNLK